MKKYLFAMTAVFLAAGIVCAEKTEREKILESYNTKYLHFVFTPNMGLCLYNGENAGKLYRLNGMGTDKELLAILYSTAKSSNAIADYEKDAFAANAFFWSGLIGGPVIAMAGYGVGYYLNYGQNQAYSIVFTSIMGLGLLIEMIFPVISGSISQNAYKNLVNAVSLYNKEVLFNDKLSCSGNIQFSVNLMNVRF
ncbi:MAG: hypothetical protein HZC28_16710 [Spirochaetes bacterium]|nr:hypothetical protein [Spirochaetota bacterium]